MSDRYHDGSRKLQDQFDTRRLADKETQVLVHDQITDQEKAFIESRDMFFLATVDRRGLPQCSYKGGDPGFVRVVDPGTIAFPCYDGNGMLLSMGNIVVNPNVGILFIDFEHPHRLRLNGTATVSDQDPLLADYHEAQLIVRVSVQELFVNCPRYIHRLKKVEHSVDVPRVGRQTPVPEWKTYDVVQDVLPARDRRRAKQA